MVLDLIALDNQSRVWIYQADRELTYEELDRARDLLFPFLRDWTSHDQMLMTYGNVFHRRYLALFVDETQAHQASGCSIDASVRFVKALEAELKVDFFNRMIYTYMVDEEIRSIKHSELKTAFTSGEINENTLFFDNLVKTKGDFLQEWVKPLQESWHYKFVQ